MYDKEYKFNVGKIDDNMGNDYDIFEDWESDAEFFYNEDWDGLEKFRYERFLQKPDDSCNQWMLGEAYILSRKYDEAIGILTEIYRKEPENPDIQISLLEALFASGKDESAFEWIEKPNVLRLDSYTLELCYRNLKGKRNFKSISDLCSDLYVTGYPAFDEMQLIHLLSGDIRFHLTNANELPCNCYVKTIKKY